MAQSLLQFQPRRIVHARVAQTAQAHGQRPRAASQHCRACAVHFIALRPRISSHHAEAFCIVEARKPAQHAHPHSSQAQLSL